LRTPRLSDLEVAGSLQAWLFQIVFAAILPSIDLVPLNPVVDTVLRVSHANAPDGSPS